MWCLYSLFDFIIYFSVCLDKVKQSNTMKAESDCGKLSVCKNFEDKYAGMAGKNTETTGVA